MSKSKRAYRTTFSQLWVWTGLTKFQLNRPWSFIDIENIKVVDWKTTHHNISSLEHQSRELKATWGNSRGRSNTFWCCLKSSADAMLTTSCGPIQKEAMGPNRWCRSMRNSCRLPALLISARLPSLPTTQSLSRKPITNACQENLSRHLKVFYC